MVWPVYDILYDDEDVMSVVGTGSIVKIFRGVAPQDTTPPFIVWNTLGGASNNYMAERPGIDNPVVQIDVYSRDEEEADTLAQYVRDALELHAHQRGQPRETWEGQPTKLYRVSLDFSFWSTR